MEHSHGQGQSGTRQTVRYGVGCRGEVRFQVEQARRRLQALFALKDEVADTLYEQDADALASAATDTFGSRAFSRELEGVRYWILWAMWTAFSRRDQDDRGSYSRTDRPHTRRSGGRRVGIDNVAGARWCRLGKQTLSLLDKELARLRALMGVDAENAKAFARLSEKISRDEAALAKLERDIEAAGRSEERIRVLIQSRRDSYAAVFDGIIEEEKELFCPVRAIEGTAGS